MFSQNKIYQKSLEVFSEDINWDIYSNKKILIVGATGLIGSYLIDMLMYVNKRQNKNIGIVAVARSEASVKERFEEYICNRNFRYIIADINNGFNYQEKVDYLLHLASNTHPLAYAEKPIETLMTNIHGTYNLLNYAKDFLNKRLLFLSSVEIYGQMENNITGYKEEDCGYLDCNSLRACYNEGKRAGEALCQAFIKEYDLDIVIPRLCRIYGPTMKLDDSKALSQFLKKAIKKENIVLKSPGEQYFSYLYVGDAVTALLHLLEFGIVGEAYNVADQKSNVKLKNLAKIIADHVGVDVSFEIADEIEQAGYSKASNAILDTKKINRLYWKAKYSINDGIKEVINIYQV